MKSLDFVYELLFGMSFLKYKNGLFASNKKSWCIIPGLFKVAWNAPPKYITKVLLPTVQSTIFTEQDELRLN